MKKDLKFIEKYRKAVQMVNYLKKEGFNNTQKYRFVSYEQYVASTKKALYECGLILYVTTESTETLGEIVNQNKKLIFREKVSIKVIISDENDFIESVFFGIGHDFSDKALAKAMTMAFKNSLRFLFMIESGEDDPERGEDDIKDIEKSNGTKNQSAEQSVKDQNSPAEIIKKHTKFAQQVYSHVLKIEKLISWQDFLWLSYDVKYDEQKTLVVLLEKFPNSIPPAFVAEIQKFQPVPMSTVSQSQAVNEMSDDEIPF